MPSTALSVMRNSTEQRVQDFLETVCAENGLHARFLNTLSLLEHIGSRKIMMSQSGATLAGNILKHLAEETRHAHFFKRAAETVAGKELSYNPGDVLAGAHARRYMDRLDAHIARSVRRPAAYLYMSLIIELRAVWFYRLYQAALVKKGRLLNLKSLLAEESRHLDEMKQHLMGLGETVETRLPVFESYEEKQFDGLLAALEYSANS